MDKRYNFDLLCNEGDEAYLRSQYPDIADRVIWPELRSTFVEHEEKAKRMKRASRSSSFIGIALIVLSLLVTLVGTSELTKVFVQESRLISNAVASLAAALLVSGLLFGRGVVLSRKRDEWLTERQQAERLRQFHFQFMISHVDLLCARAVQTKVSWDKIREKELERVRRTLSGNTYTKQVKDDQDLSETFIADMNRLRNVKDFQSVDSNKFQQFKLYYREFRMDWQEDYVDIQFEERASPISATGSLFEREKFANAVEHAATLGIVLFQFGAVLCQILDDPHSPITQALVLGSSVLAITIVGLHAFRDGTSVTDDLVRYRHYSSKLKHARRAFDEADREHDESGVLAAAMRIEEAAYFEMREFLIAHSKPKLSL
ncbi:hypothetical protein P2H44_07620 [Albimonas sp. CAU 1670]|uniref:hypothetical protein n=1 Tax=Albimonas sp. CAU 1670 TaxID=3032599 RepID=UPI0023DB4A0A|nr:hypothetical protein [Albimonas sp. CAU 1670]MDF2232417.1 hypothetical protein [Albimonas sp. CAU 1670]